MSAASNSRARRSPEEARVLRLLGNGVRKHCPNCGSGHLYDTWFRMKERCPRCGMRFEREPGFFVGAYLVNFAAIIVVLFVLCMGVVAVKARDASADPTAILILGLVLSVTVPIVFYPFARTIWSAFDLALKPLEDDELADAALHADTTAAGSDRSEP